MHLKGLDACLLPVFKTLTSRSTLYSKSLLKDCPNHTTGSLRGTGSAFSESPAPSAHPAGVLEGILRKEPTSMIPGSPGAGGQGERTTALALELGASGSISALQTLTVRPWETCWPLRTSAPSTVEWGTMALIPKHLLTVSREFGKI